MKRVFYYSVLIPAFFLFFGYNIIAGKTKTYNQPVYTAFDTETTGVNSSTDRIIEIAAVKFTSTKIIEQKSWLINPGIKIPKQATRIHGITDSMTASAPSFEKVFQEFKTFTGNSTLIAHNAKFDARFIVKESSRYNLELPENEIIDSLILFRAWFPDLKSHSLSNLSRDLEINTEKLHRALADSECVRRIINLAIENEQKRKEFSEISGSDHPALTNFKPAKK